MVQLPLQEGLKGAGGTGDSKNIFHVLAHHVNGACAREYSMFKTFPSSYQARVADKDDLLVLKALWEFV